jgi:hypothetical protein
MTTAPPGDSGTRVEVPLSAEEKGELRRRAREEGGYSMGVHMRRLLLADLEANPAPAGDEPRRGAASTPAGPVR